MQFDYCFPKISLLRETIKSLAGRIAQKNKFRGFFFLNVLTNLLCISLCLKNIHTYIFNKRKCLALRSLFNQSKKCCVTTRSLDDSKRVFFPFDCIEINPVPHVIWAWAVGSRKGSRSPAACSADVIRATFSFYRFSAKHLLPSYVPAWVVTDMCCLLFGLVLFLEVAKLTFYICFREM